MAAPLAGAEEVVAGGMVAQDARARAPRHGWTQPLPSCPGGRHGQRVVLALAENDRRRGLVAFAQRAPVGFGQRRPGARPGGAELGGGNGQHALAHQGEAEADDQGAVQMLPQLVFLARPTSASSWSLIASTFSRSSRL